METLASFSRRFRVFRRKVERTVDNFLPRNQKRTENLMKEVVRTTVYAVYTPARYDRTYDLLKSMRAIFPTEGNTREMHVISDPDIAAAKTVSGGYGRFVAGEGPGIGFLNTEQNFPRPFPDAAYPIIAADLFQRVVAQLDGHITTL